MSEQVHYKNNRFQQLKGFCNTIRTGSMSEAAKNMSLSQAAVSLQIKSLERDLKLPLFKRHKNKLTPTKEGKMFYAHSVEYMQGLEELYENFSKHIDKEKSRVIDIAANHVSMCHILPKYIKKFEEKYPQVQFKIRNLTKEDALKRLRSNKVDIALYSDSDKSLDDLKFESIVTYKPILLVSKDHNLAEQENVTLSDIKKYDLLKLDNKFVTIPNFDEITKSLGLKTKIEFEMANYEILKKFIRAKVGIAILSSICLEGENEPELIVKDLSNFFSDISYGILFKKGKNFSGLLLEFVEMLRTEKLLNVQN
jgi:DNA-binding transcriptional LysR family regulator